MDNKTYKREVAGAMLLSLLAAHLWGVYDERVAEMARFLTTPIFMFAGGAFGMDAIAKQMR